MNAKVSQTFSKIGTVPTLLKSNASGVLSYKKIRININEL
jgi:hypothetical protein